MGIPISYAMVAAYHMHPKIRITLLYIRETTEAQPFSPQANYFHRLYLASPFSCYFARPAEMLSK